ASTCRYALKVLLTDYGDFKVSTIDSFFQTVLRTFAYEADLDDTYQIELDSDYVIQIGLDTTLDDIDTDHNSSQGAVWIGSMMENKAGVGKGWNIFQKDTKSNSVYGEILKASHNLNKEDFKDIRESLDSYFEEYPDFYNTFNSLCKHYEGPQRDAFARMRSAARAVRDAFRDAGLDINETAGTYLASRVRNMAESWDWDHPIDSGASFKIPEFTRKGATTRVFHPKKENPYLGSSVEDHIQKLAENMYACFDTWRAAASSDRMARWRIYRATMPLVGILQSVRGNARLFLTDSNTVELGETNSILKRIIGEDDAPFVYERLGSRLEHFLIDEFQDTSALQWHNLRPLLLESESKDFDNLIIGDAKQSIYRFRNADPSLITEKVPIEFARSCRICGASAAENTNWRSSLRIVKFNNLFFRFFSDKLGDRMISLYSNTVQPSSHKENVGYVSVRLFDSPKGAKEEAPAHFDEIPRLIADMLDRDYRMNEIAVLVDTREQGSQVIERIMLYNLREDNERKINFISADSLQAGESPAVQTIISILEAINNGTEARLNPKEERKDKGAGDWSRLRADFSFFAMRHPDTPLSELLSEFLAGGYNPDSIREMLASMSTTVLPALVENIIRSFIPEHSRRSEAAFLAALQDMVIEYCESHTSDIASFLQWWEMKGKYRSISSPEDADAVNIMTVHKSKGLEFRCVIVACSKQTIKPTSSFQKEWLWVRPDLSDAEGIPQIPWIPVWSEPKLEKTIHAEDYLKYLENYKTDKVNMAYVAYTRAIDELYIYTPGTIKDGKVSDDSRIGSFLWECGAQAEKVIPKLLKDYPDIDGHIPSADEISVDADGKTWSFGEPLTEKEIEAGRKAKDVGQGSVTVPDYRCGSAIPALIYSDPSSPDATTLPSDLNDEDPEENETEETRRYGELMHSIMERISTASDLHRALLATKSAGQINLTRMKELETLLSKALKSVEPYGWFSPGSRVICERGIVFEGKVRRPDRIVMRPDGTAVIVDYKFGNHRNDKAYARQVKRYASALLQTGLAKNIEAYIWYVSLGEVFLVKD
ncbi:MAG: UvrD-helicase domain-containing protein, partial [Muribaculaceae bacterium]|nr:UvrD-helicase domain-containing protein [Muribaculaceae bacterium]